MNKLVVAAIVGAGIAFTAFAASLCQSKTSSGPTCGSQLLKCNNCGTVGCGNAAVYCPNSIFKPKVGNSACKMCGKWNVRKLD